MRIFLIGYMGSGKSTVGKRLAQKMNLTFFDLDPLIEKRTGKTIPVIFLDYGENAFRRIEKETLSEILQADNYVLSTGGGTPCFFDNLEQMNLAGTSFYLKMDAGMLAHRLFYSKTERPLLAGKSREELFDFIKQNLAEREVFYSQAKHSINGAEFQVKEILRLLNNS
ncbi:MAG: shikimate kinase [Bacteroidales bacterium]|nr:shikimate kinase [Bacteroidales bacterium]MCF8456972.1 shikimate kinase [Bacteroidales bacterium]